jgi:hypothetical protein
MFKTKTKMAALIAALMSAFMLVGVGAAQATTGPVTRGGTCNVSANWTIGASAHWSNTNILSYVVMTSPGPLYAPYNATDGSRYFLADNIARSGWVYKGIISGKYTYRSEASFNALSVRVDPMTNTNVRCPAYINLHY